MGHDGTLVPYSQGFCPMVCGGSSHEFSGSRRYTLVSLAYYYVTSGDSKSLRAHMYAIVLYLV